MNTIKHKINNIEFDIKCPELNENIQDLYNKLEIDGYSHWRPCANMIEDVINITKPNRILEIGFFLGSSCFQWLYLSNAEVSSCDPIYCKDDDIHSKIHNIHIDKPRSFLTINNLCRTFRDRFKFLLMDSIALNRYISANYFDLLFVDGCHDYHHIKKDIELAIHFNIKYVLLDDFQKDVYNCYFDNFSDKFEIICGYQTKNSGNLIDNLLLKNKNA